MMERSLRQEQEYWDQKVGEARLKVQESREHAEEYKKFYDRIVATEPISPVAGKVQRHILDVCDDMHHRYLQQAVHNQEEVERMKAGRP